MKKNLKARIKNITEMGLPLMDGKKQLNVETIMGTEVTVDDYGYLNGDNGEYVVITLKEYPTYFMYGASVVTQSFKELDSALSEDERIEILQEGLTFMLTEKKSKNGYKYHKMTFFPNDEE